MDKPIVYFYDKPVFHNTVDDEGNDRYYAVVRAMKHPVWGTQTVRTSLIVGEHSEEGFTTMNTVYKAYKGKDNE